MSHQNKTPKTEVKNLNCHSKDIKLGKDSPSPWNQRPGIHFFDFLDPLQIYKPWLRVVHSKILAIKKFQDGKLTELAEFEGLLLELPSLQGPVDEEDRYYISMFKSDRNANNQKNKGSISCYREKFTTPPRSSKNLDKTQHLVYLGKTIPSLLPYLSQTFLSPSNLSFSASLVLGSLSLKLVRQGLFSGLFSL